MVVNIKRNVRTHSWSIIYCQRINCLFTLTIIICFIEALQRAYMYHETVLMIKNNETQTHRKIDLIIEYIDSLKLIFPPFCLNIISAINSIVNTIQSCGTECSLKVHMLLTHCFSFCQSYYLRFSLVCIFAWLRWQLCSLLHTFANIMLASNTITWLWDKSF